MNRAGESPMHHQPNQQLLSAAIKGEYVVVASIIGAARFRRNRGAVESLTAACMYVTYYVRESGFSSFVVRSGRAAD